jgi:hypothetical protein
MGFFYEKFSLTPIDGDAIWEARRDTQAEPYR